MATSPKTLVAVATYNEIENLPSLVDAIEQRLPEADVLIVDDNSPDGTGDWARERMGRDERVTWIGRSGKQGLGSASYLAFEFALEHGYEAVVTLDADWSHPPDRLPALLDALQGADVAIGSRYCPGGAIEGWPRRRRVTSWVLNAVARRLLRLPPADCSGAFRAYRTEKLGLLDFDRALTRGYAYLEEVLWRLKRVDATFAETPITFRDRHAGASKINWREAASAARVLFVLGLREWFGWRRV